MKEYKTIAMGYTPTIIYDLSYERWIGARNAVVVPSEHMPGVKMVCVRQVIDQDIDGFIIQRIPNPKSEWYTLSAKVKTLGMVAEKFMCCFLTTYDIKTDDDITMLIDGQEMELQGGYGLVGFAGPVSDGWHDLVAKIKMDTSNDFSGQDAGGIFCVALGYYDSGVEGIFDLIQLEYGEAVTPWLPNYKDF